MKYINTIGDINQNRYMKNSMKKYARFKVNWRYICNNADMNKLDEIAGKED
jgi:hypothetical protein